MTEKSTSMRRREFLAAALATGTTPGAGKDADEPAPIAITLDLEMSRHYPTWDQTRWDYEKGNLDVPTRRYAVAAARRVEERGGRIHFFALGRTMEQEDVGWLREILDAGHPVGNHTYDHVNVKATRPDDIQFRFRRCPWLIAGREPSAVIAENIRLATAAFKTRLGLDPAGFRTPGGFDNGLDDRPDVQQLLLDQGYTWVSSRYPAHPAGRPGMSPGDDVFDAIVAAQARSQPTVYPTGLVEVPMSPISDVTAFRAARWGLDAFLEATRRAVSWAIEHRAAFDFLAHPSCLVVTDPEFRTIDLICDLVRQAGDRARLVDLATIAGRAAPRS